MFLWGGGSVKTTLFPILFNSFLAPPTTDSLYQSDWTLPARARILAIHILVFWRRSVRSRTLTRAHARRTRWVLVGKQRTEERTHTRLCPSAQQASLVRASASSSHAFPRPLAALFGTDSPQGSAGEAALPLQVCPVLSIPIEFWRIYSQFSALLHDSGVSRRTVSFLQQRRLKIAFKPDCFGF